MKIFFFAAIAAVAAAAGYGGAASVGQDYVQHIKQRNSHLSHPPIAQNPPLPELYVAASQTHFTQLYGNSEQDSYSQLYGSSGRQPSSSRASGGYGRPEPEEDDEYQPGYGRPAQPPPQPAYPQPPPARRPVSYPSQQTTTTTKRPTGSGGYQNVIEDDDDEGLPSGGYGRPVVPTQPPSRRPVSYPLPSTTRPRTTTTTTTRRPVVGYPQPSRDDYEKPPTNPGYHQPARRPVSTARPVSYPRPTVRTTTTTTTTRRPNGGYPTVDLEDVDTSGYNRPVVNTPPPPPPPPPVVYPQPPQTTARRPSNGAYGNDLEDVEDQQGYHKPQQVVKPPVVAQRPTGGYPSTDLEEVEQSGYGRPQNVRPVQPTGGYPSTDLEDVEPAGYGGPSRGSTSSVHVVTEQRPQRPSLLPARRTSSYPKAANELPNPAAASRVQHGFAGAPSNVENPDYFPQGSTLAHSAWPAAAPPVAAIPAFSDETPIYEARRPGGYGVLNQQW